MKYILEFEHFVEGYQAAKDFDMNKLQHYGKELIGNINKKTSEIGDEVSSVFIPPDIKKLPGFSRIMYRDANTKLRLAIDYQPLDIMYEMDLRNIPVYSKWQHDKINKKTLTMSGDFSMYSKGSALYYGWNAPSVYNDDPYFSIILTVLNARGRPGYDYRMTPEDENEMYDIVYKLYEGFKDVQHHHKEFLDPAELTDDKMDDSVDYFH